MEVTSKVICMYASNIHLFLTAQKQSTQLCQSTAFYYEILIMKAKMFLWLLGGMMMKSTMRGWKRTVLCVHWLAVPAITVGPSSLSSYLSEANA